MESVAEKIERFAGYFGQHIEAILRIEDASDDALYVRLLLTTLLDTLARVAYPAEGDASRRRYVKFVVLHSGWKDVERVSLLHLNRLLAKESSPDFLGLKQWAEERLNMFLPIDAVPRLIRHPSETERDISGDPTLAEVLSLWPHGPNGALRIDHARPEDLHHGSLLYQYRSHLVHEFRVPGKGWDVKRTGTPFYQRFAQAVDFLRPVAERWELVYPLEFLGKLCRDSLASLRELLISESRNPFEALKEGSFWIPALN
jgi:hypothetical protein